jgi:hypothetical protein
VAEIDGSLIFEALKSIKSRLDRMDLTLGKVKSELAPFAATSSPRKVT